MNEGSSKTNKRKKAEHDFATVAYRVVQESIAAGEPSPEEEPTPPEPTPEERHAMAITLGRAGGKKGGKARAAKLTPEQRSEIGRNAAQARWENDEETSAS